MSTTDVPPLLSITGQDASLQGQTALESPITLQDKS